MIKFQKAPKQDRFRRPVPQLIVLYSLILALAGVILLAVFDESFHAFPKALLLILIFIGFFFGIIALHFIVGFIVSLLLPKKEPKHWHPLAWAFSVRILEVIFFFARVHVRYEGLDKLDPDAQYLFVSNHLSMFDPMVSMIYLNHYKPIYITKPSNMKIPLAGPFIRFLRYQSIDRENPRNALVTLNHTVDLAGKPEHCSIGVYPEGTRSKTGELLPFHEGMFLIAKRAKLSLCVLRIDGSQNIAHHFPMHRTDVTVKVCDVIPADEVGECRTAELSDRSRDLILGAMESNSDKGRAL